MSNNTRITLERLQEALEADYRRFLQEAQKAVNEAPGGVVIPASEEPFRDAVARFRRAAFEKAVQLKADAAASAFSPSGRNGGAAAPEQGGPDA